MFEHRLDFVERLGDRRGAAREMTGPLDLESQRCELLAQVIVEGARDAPTLLLLRAADPPQESQTRLLRVAQFGALDTKRGTRLGRLALRIARRSMWTCDLLGIRQW